MAWRIAKSLLTLRTQINSAFPTRDRSSDGSIGDPAHSARKSDHNPNSAGVVCAIDIDEDLNDGSLESVVTAIRASRDPRVNYIIYEGLITEKGSDLQRWKKYSGANAHKHHAHISVKQDPKLYDDESPWAIAPVDDIPHPNKPNWPVLQVGSEGQLVKILQSRLVELGHKITVDGEFGPATERAVRSFQNTKGLTADGKVGTMTREALGI